MLSLTIGQTYNAVQLNTLTPLSAGQVIQADNGSTLTSTPAILAGTPAIGLVSANVIASLMANMHFIPTLPPGGASAAGGPSFGIGLDGSNSSGTLTQLLIGATTLPIPLVGSGGQGLLPPSGVPGYSPADPQPGSNTSGLATVAATQGPPAAATLVIPVNVPHPSSGPITPGQGPLSGLDTTAVYLPPS